MRDSNLEKCVSCETAAIPGEARPVRCAACGRRHVACPDCWDTFIGCDDDCRKKYRQMVQTDQGQKEIHQMHRGRGSTRKPKEDPGQGRLF